MPNWCNNRLTLNHNDPSKIQAIVQACANQNLFETFMPVPENLDDMDAYHWRISNWGTKWEPNFYDDVEAESPNTVSFAFDSAWAPPIGFYSTLEEEGFQVEALYYEPGMGFCGLYQDGSDDYYDIEGNSKWVEENIPEEIDEEFSISESMEMWEAEEEL